MKPTPIDKEYHLSEDDFIVSKTDVYGNLTYANMAFIKISGYTEEEFLNQPHSIMRHPDMPKKAFESMWTTIKQGKEWHGIVKNLCKDGGFYWVDATVTPSFKNEDIIGYMSVRRQASPDQIQKATIEYSELKSHE